MGIALASLRGPRAEVLRLAQRLDADLPRMAADDESSEPASAKARGYLGIVLGSIRIAVAGVALVRQRDGAGPK